MTRNGVSLALFSVGKMGHRIILLRLSAVLRNAVVMCRPRITPDHYWHKRVVGSIGTENRLKGDHPTARPQDLSDFEGVGALRASRPQAG